MRAKIVATYGVTLWIVYCQSGAQPFTADNRDFEFRPIRTERDKAIDALGEWYNAPTSMSVNNDLGGLLDLLDDGKIQGYGPIKAAKEALAKLEELEGVLIVDNAVRDVIHDIHGHLKAYK